MGERDVIPILWRVVKRTVGAVDTILLGDTTFDSYRIAVTITGGAGLPEVDTQVVFPCRACGWASACADGEDCHS